MSDKNLDVVDINKPKLPYHTPTLKVYGKVNPYDIIKKNNIMSDRLSPENLGKEL